jgi:uncharacterized protein (TIGR02246 family)
MSDQPPPAVVKLLQGAYAAFNARDVAAVLAVMHPDVDWPNVLEGTRLHGRDQVRQYWTRQFESIDPQLEVQSISPDPEGRVVVEVLQVVRALDGTLLDERRIKHRYMLHDGLVARMDVVPAN